MLTKRAFKSSPQFNWCTLDLGGAYWLAIEIDNCIWTLASLYITTYIENICIANLFVINLAPRMCAGVSFSIYYMAMLPSRAPECTFGSYVKGFSININQVVNLLNLLVLLSRYEETRADGFRICTCDMCTFYLTFYFIQTRFTCMYIWPYLYKMFTPRKTIQIGCSSLLVVP